MKSIKSIILLDNFKKTDNKRKNLAKKLDKDKLKIKKASKEL